MSELDIEVARRRSPELIDLCIDSTEENEVENIGANEEQNSAEIASDLEEGEIIEPKNEVCRHFQRGRCWLGKNCSFLHVGTNPYKMFDPPNIQFNTQNFRPVLVYQPIIIDQSMEGPPDAWDRGLNEAKKLLLNAKLKKESDLDFEEKQLYQGLDEIINENKDMYLGWKRKKACSNSRHETSNRGSHAPKTIAKELSCTRKHGNAKLKRKNSRSNSVSPIPLRRRQSPSPVSSSFSSCSRCKVLCKGGHESEKDIRKTKSKMERVFSRIFGSPETLRSRKRNSRGPHLSRRSLSKHSSIKRNLYQSYSKSPSLKNNYLKNRPEYPPRKPPYKKPFLPTTERSAKIGSSHSKNERNGSPICKLRSENYAHDLESSSSDMTVSSIQCTSVSTSYTISEEEKSKSTIMVSKRILNGEHAREHVNTRDINKWLDTVPNVTTKGSESNSKIPKKVVDKKEKNSTKSVKKDNTHGKRKRKLSSSRTSDEELSADELELLRYVPNKNRKKLEQKKEAAIPTSKTPVKQLPQKDCETNKENLTTETVVKYPPPKIVYDYGSDIEELPSKLIHDYDSDPRSSEKSAGSKRAEPTPNTIVEHLLPKNVLDHETNGENLFQKELNGDEQVDDVSKKSESAMQAKCSSTKGIIDADIPKQLDENRAGHKKDPPRTNKSKSRRSSDSSVERPLSKDEMELLKYVSFCKPRVSKKIQKQKRKNPSVLDDKKAKQKTVSDSYDIKNSPKLKSAEQKKEKSTKISRRDELMQQLKAVELAIAEKKEQAKLEYAKLKRERLSAK